MKNAIMMEDGSYIVIAGSQERLTPGELYTYRKGLLMYVENGQVFLPWVGTKKDLDGNSWTFIRSEQTISCLVVSKSGSTVLSTSIAITGSGYSLVGFTRNNYEYITFTGFVGRNDPSRNIPGSFMNSTDSVGDDFATYYANNPSKSLFNALPNGNLIYAPGDSQYWFGGTGSRLSNYEKSLAEAPTDPYMDGGTSYPAGGDGTFDFSSTDVLVPSLPAISASDAGFITLFNPSSSQLKSLAQYMWSPTFSIENFKKIFADPMDAILGLHIVPTISGHPQSEASELVVGNISTGLTMPRLTEQYYELDCGEIQIQPKWGAYLDYSPYSQLNLYLPYIGFVHISPDDCMNGSIKVVYHVDVFSGSCVAFVYCNSNRGADGHVLYSFNGSCVCMCPVTNGQYANIMEFVVAAAQGVAGLATPVPGGIASAAAIASGMQGVSSAIDAVKPSISRSGFAGGSAGLIGIQYPYLVLTVPRMCTPGYQNTYIGYPSFVTKKMGNLSGYTEIDVTHLNNLSCTEAEANEIIELLRKGVIF